MIMAKKKLIGKKKDYSELIKELQRIERTQKFYSFDKVVAELYLKEK